MIFGESLPRAIARVGAEALVDMKAEAEKDGFNLNEFQIVKIRRRKL